MKQVKKLLTLLLAIGLFITALPIQANAEYPASRQATDFQQLLKNVKTLEEFAVDYSKENPGKDPVALTVKYIRSGREEYNSGFWNNLAGYEDSKFAAYVQERENAQNAETDNLDNKVRVTGLRNIGSVQAPNGDMIDVGQMFAVMDAYYYNDGNDAYADAAGWAGDLVELMVVADSEDISGTLDELVSQIDELYFLQADAFDREKFVSNLDGYAFAVALMSKDYESGRISSIIGNYYSESLDNTQRADYFLKNRLDGVTARGDIREAVFAYYTGNENVASLENNQNFTSDSLSDLRKACCYVFADYLCMLAGDYVEWNENIYYSVTDSEKITVTSGVTHEKLTATTSDDKQMVYYLATADVSNPYVNVYMNYNNNNPAAGWGMQSVRKQAYAAEARHSDPSNEELYIPNYNVVVAVNGAGYNMTTGEPAGLLMMEGVEHHAPDGIDHDGYAFFGILKDGSAVIGSTEDYYDLKEKDLLAEGIDVFGATLVKDGEIVIDYSSTHTMNRHSRTAVGITRTGKVVMMTLDGRQEPVSCGGSYQEIAQIMLDAGCVDAVNLDGGGSTTFLAQLPGDDDLSLVNKPSDGFERSVSASMIIVSTMPDPTAFDHAVLEASAEYLTVGTQVQMEATGVNAVGDTVELPEGAAWNVSDSTVASISADGVLTGLKNGQVEVSLVLGGQTVGTKKMHIVVPDAIYFEKNTMGVVRGDTVALPVAALYGGKQVAISPADLTITLSNTSAGAVDGFEFTADADTDVKSVMVTAAVARNTAISGSMTIMLYNKDETTFDFVSATAGDQRLAWLRQVSNATTSDHLSYLVEDINKPMLTGYTVAFDVSEMPIDPAIQNAVFEQLGITQDKNEAFLLQLADQINAEAGSSVTLKITMDKNLDVDLSKVGLTSELFSLERAEMDSESNTISLLLSWKAQNAPLRKENTNTVCILTGIIAEPKEDAAWNDKKRLSVVNEIAMDYAIAIDEIDASVLAGSYVAGKDSYVLINALKNGWVYEEGGYAYYEEGVRYTGVCKVGEFYYDFGQSGINVGQNKYTGLFMENDVCRYAKDGLPTSGWHTEGDAHYYFDENGIGYNGTIKVDEVDMTFENGLHVGGFTGFLTQEGNRVYHYTKGVKDYGWVEIGEDLYHFNTDTGIMTTGTKVLPDEEAKAKGAYYDFDEDGRALRGYFNDFGYYYWAGVPRRNDWVKDGADTYTDPDAWYRTNTNGHFVTDSTGKETFDLEIDGKIYPAVKIECEGVVYTFDTRNGKLLKGDFVYENGKGYYYWAGQPVNDGWFEIDGNTYYAYEDGCLAIGSNTIDGEAYMFTADGKLVKEGMIITAELSEDFNTMKIRIVEAAESTKVRIAVWPKEAGQDGNLIWCDMNEIADGVWEVTVPMCQFDVDSADTYELHAYSVEPANSLLINTTVYVAEAAEHQYSDNQDESCNNCGFEREVQVEIKTTPMYRLYNPNSGEHFYTGSIEEKDNLVAAGWIYEGIAWNAPTNTGAPVYRLYNPNSGDHHYTMSAEERDMLVGVGWIYEGVAWNSAPVDHSDAMELHRLYNPNADCGSHHYTGSIEERDFLVSVGWIYEGIGWFGMLR